MWVEQPLKLLFISKEWLSRRENKSLVRYVLAVLLGFLKTLFTKSSFKARDS